MKKGMIGPLIFSIIVGGIFAKFMFMQYQPNDTVASVSKLLDDSTSIYFLQVGVYSSIENMKKSCAQLEHYIYREEDEKYHVYVAITGKEENAEKLKEYYQEQGYVIYVKSLAVSSREFIKELETYDDLLSKTSDKKAISVVISDVLNRYKELVINNDKN